MTALSQGIDALYFEYWSVAEHLEGCSRRGTDVWEVTRYRWELRYSVDKTEVTLRMACHECGVAHFERADADLSVETSSASEIGYASKPEKVAGVWLWPGPRIWYGDERGPACYLITATRERPRKPADVLGKVAWSLGSRGGVRWSAGLGCTEHHTVAVAAGQHWPSRRAAVAWVTEHAAGGNR